MTELTRHERLRRALANEPVDRPPIWFMRQAGRYMAEYRELRSRVSFNELCESSDLACEVTLQPINEFEVDAAIVFSDILPVLTAIGRPFELIKGFGPKIHDPVRSVSDAKSLVRPDVEAALPVAAETITKFRAARPDVPILGFAGAPYTLFCYLVEGSGSKNWLHPKQMLYNEPETAQAILDLLADVVGDYLQSQVEAGAAAIQLFDTWAGSLSQEDYKRWALPAAQRALARVNGAPRLYFAKDMSPMLHLVQQTGADAFGIDWRTDLGRARAALGANVPVQGNLDPVALYAPPAEVSRRCLDIIREAGPTGHIFNLGHGVLPTTPLEGVRAMVETVKNFRWANEPS